MKLVAAILLVFILAAPVASHDLDKNEEMIKVDNEIAIHYQYFERVIDLYFRTGWSAAYVYFYPEILEQEDFPDNEMLAGEYRYNQTHEAGISYNLTYVGFRNWTGDAYSFALWQPCSLDRMSFSFGTFQTTKTNISAGTHAGYSANARVADEGMKSGVSVVFDFEMGIMNQEDWLGCEFGVAINVTALFVSTYYFHEWNLGGCIQDFTSKEEFVILTVLALGGVMIIGFRYVKATKKGTKSTVLDSDIVGDCTNN